MFFGFNPFSFTLNFLVIQVSGYFMSAANSYYSNMNCVFGISLIAKMKEYGFFLCLLIRAPVIPPPLWLLKRNFIFAPGNYCFLLYQQRHIGHKSHSQALCCVLCLYQGFYPCLVPDEPYNAFCHSLRSILKVIARIHLKHCLDAQRLVVIIQSYGVLLNRRHYLIARPGFLVSE